MDSVHSENSLRSPDEVMHLNRLGAFHQSRLSFVRSLVRNMATERWKFNQIRNELDDNGYGLIVYRIQTPHKNYDFVAFSTPLSADERSDRVIAERWDSSFALIDGEADENLIQHLAANAPKQEQGRMLARVLVMSRANRSVRLFDYVVKMLAQGRQPSATELSKSGYLLRTTAVYGNGKFGLGDFHRIANNTVMKASFRAQMLAVYLVRQFSFDLVNHIARYQSEESRTNAVELAPQLRRYLGIGNATGLGMAPFLVSHPALINRWIAQRELAIARVCKISAISIEQQARFEKLCQRARTHFQEFATSDNIQQQRYDDLVRELGILIDKFHPKCDSLADKEYPWQSLCHWSRQHTSIETQELVHSLILELHPEIVDPLAEQMDANEPVDIDSAQSIDDLIDTIENHYSWALSIDFDRSESQQVFWYRSEEKEEPRLGHRFEEAGAELELDIGVARDVKALHHRLTEVIADQTTGSLSGESLVGEYILQRPRSRGLIRRIQHAANAPFAEIQDNLIASDCRPIDLLRCKLSFFGASRFDPKSDLWTRITLFQGAPLPNQLVAEDADDWAFPIMPRVVLRDPAA